MILLLGISVDSESVRIITLTKQPDFHHMQTAPQGDGAPERYAGVLAELIPPGLSADMAARAVDVILAWEASGRLPIELVAELYPILRNQADAASPET
jgi:hypothetical protein